MKVIELMGEIWQEGNMFTAYCHELDLASCGRTVEEARHNLREAIGIFLEETARKGTLRDLLEEAGFQLGEATASGRVASRAKFCALEKIELPLGVS